MTHPDPSRTIIVEPVEVPAVLPDPKPEKERPAEPVEPEKEPVPVP